jgi:GWxTD domain-containing protein
MRSALLLSITAVLFTGALPPADSSSPAVGDLGLSLAEWYAGPVRYLLTKEEDKEVRRLETDDERMEFVRRFWARRDPTPETPENEARELLWRRVLEANRLFTDTIKEGWRTDRGRTYILLGPPDEREVDPMPQAGRGEIRWVYRSSPARGASPNQIIAFRQDRSGEYRLSTDPRDYNLVWSFYTRADLILSPLLTAIWNQPVPGLTRAQIMLDLGRLERPPTEEEILAEMVTAEEILGPLPFHGRFDFYRSEGGLTFVAINLGVQRWLLSPEAADADLLPVARLESIDDPGRVFNFVYRNPFAAAGDNDSVPPRGYLLYQAGQGIPPGRYRTFLGLFHRSRGQVASRHGQVEVPSFAGTRLGLSSLALARTLEQASAEESSSPYKRPFVLAGRRVIPAIGHAYRNGDTFALYFQVYNARRDADGRPELEARYRFFSLEGHETRSLGEPVLSGPLHEQAVAWSFPLEGWPVASFRLEVQVTDRISGDRASAHVDFIVDE